MCVCEDRLPVLQEVQLGETGSNFAEDTPTEPDLTAGKKDVFLVDVSRLTLCEL